MERCRSGKSFRGQIVICSPCRMGRSYKDQVIISTPCRSGLNSIVRFFQQSGRKVLATHTPILFMEETNRVVR